MTMDFQVSLPSSFELPFDTGAFLLQGGDIAYVPPSFGMI